MENEKLLTRKEVAAILRIKPRALYNYTAPRGPLPCVRFDRNVRYKSSDVEKWIEENTKGGQK